MKFALVQGVRHEASPGSSGICPACTQPVTAKCGEIKVWHWAHKGKRSCDPWWENETEWHRNWKNQFPLEWQEVLHLADNGEKHIADVKTNHGWVIEIQHSYLKPEERRSRSAFYSKLAWVVDGTRRMTDVEKFRNAITRGRVTRSGASVHIVQPEDSPLLSEWSEVGSPVFFDFGPGPSLWWLLGRGASGYSYVMPFARSEFVEIHRNGATQTASAFHSLVGELGDLISDFESQLFRRR